MASSREKERKKDPGTQGFGVPRGAQVDQKSREIVRNPKQNFVIFSIASWERFLMNFDLKMVQKWGRNWWEIGSKTGADN